MKTPPAPLAALLLLLGGCGPSKASLPATPPAEAAVGVRTVKPQADAGAVLRSTGELRARHEATLSPEVSGRILRFRVDVGSRVARGDVLVELDETTARIQVQQARAARAAAEAAHRSALADLKRTQELARGDAAPPAVLERATLGEEQAAAALQQAGAALAAAEDQLAKHVVRAPFDGVVTARMKSAGEYVAMMPPTPVLALVDVSTVEVRAPVPETVVDLLAPGAELDATVSPSGKPFRARIRAIGAQVEPAGRTVEVRADPVGPLFRELRPGAIVELRLGAAAPGAGGVFLPAATVREAAGERFVWTVVGNEARRRPVQVEHLSPGTVRVTSGLGPSDLVVASDDAGLADGARVRVLE